MTTSKKEKKPNWEPVEEINMSTQRDMFLIIKDSLETVKTSLAEKKQNLLLLKNRKI